MSAIYDPVELIDGQEVEIDARANYSHPATHKADGSAAHPESKIEPPRTALVSAKKVGAVALVQPAGLIVDGPARHRSPVRPADRPAAGDHRLAYVTAPNLAPSDQPPPPIVERPALGPRGHRST